MPGAILIATQLTDHSTVTKTLTIGGQQVLAEPGGGFGTPIESITVTEAGPSGVSSMDFDIWDPTLEILIVQGQAVEFWDVTLNAPIFRGYLQSWSYEPRGPSRFIHVRCIGIEALLDWMVLPTSYVSSTADSVTTSILFMLWPIPSPLIVARDLVETYGQSGSGIANGLAQGGVATGMTVGTIAAGTTLREAIRNLIELGYQGIVGNPPVEALVTVDFGFTLRVWPAWQNDVSLAQPHDYTTLTVSDTTGGTIAASNLEHETDATGISHQVFVIGSSPTFNVLVTDGTGLPGPTAVLDDTVGASLVETTAAGMAYLAQDGNQTAVRGTLQLDAFTPVLTIHAGSLLDLTDVQAGVAGEEFRIYSITKTFNPGGTENWTVGYGGHPKSAMRTTRQLTRDVRS